MATKSTKIETDLRGEIRTLRRDLALEIDRVSSMVHERDVYRRRATIAETAASDWKRMLELLLSRVNVQVSLEEKDLIAVSPDAHSEYVHREKSGGGT